MMWMGGQRILTLLMVTCGTAQFDGDDGIHSAVLEPEMDSDLGVASLSADSILFAEEERV